MNPTSLISELASKLGVDGLSLDDNGLACLVVDGSLKVNVEHDQTRDLLHLYTVLGSVPASGKEAVYEMLLTGNLFGEETRGSTLAIDPITSEFVISRTLIPAHLDVAGFEAELEQFIEAALTWVKKVEEGANDTSAAGTESTEFSLPQGGIRA